MGSYPPPQSTGEPQHTPEILPPEQYTGQHGGYGYGYVPPPPPEPPRRPRRGWASAPATYTLIGINCALFALMCLQGISPIRPDSLRLVNWGADNAGLVLVGGEWWRIVAAMFLHAGFIHLATNMWCLWNLGLLAEPLMGSWGVVAAYLLTGAAGNLLSTLKSWWAAYPDLMRFAAQFHVSVSAIPVDQIAAFFSPGVGASGAVFGIAGALIVLLKSDRLPVPQEELKKLRRSVILFAVINLVIPIGVNFGADVMRAGFQIDYMAHIGGVCCGLLFAAPMLPRIGVPREQFRSRLRLAVGLVTGVLVLFGFYLAQMPR